MSRCEVLANRAEFFEQLGIELWFHLSSPARKTGVRRQVREWDTGAAGEWTSSVSATEGWWVVGTLRKEQWAQTPWEADSSFGLCMSVIGKEETGRGLCSTHLRSSGSHTTSPLNGAVGNPFCTWIAKSLWRQSEVVFSAAAAPEGVCHLFAPSGVSLLATDPGRG